MKTIIRNFFRKVYYAIYGKSGKAISINNETFTVSAYVSRGINSEIDELPLKLLINLSKKANILFDIGANIGLVATILSKKMKKGSMIYSFEPAPLSFKYLFDMARVQKGNSTIVPVNLAVSNNNGKLYFTNDGNSCTNHVTDVKENSIAVDSITIDEFCLKNNIVPEVIKVDIEGAEFWALEGMKQTLLLHDCVVLIEIHTDFLKENEINSSMFGQIIDSIGYRTYDSLGNEISNKELMSNSCVILSKTTLPKEIFQV